MKFKHLLLCFLLTVSLACTALLSGCVQQSESVKEIVSVQKTMTVGLVDTYTITYSDGSTYNFEITNGKDADDLSVEELYQAYISRNPDASFEDFLESLYSGNPDTTLTVCNKALLSSLKVYTEFTERNYSYGFGMHQQKRYETAVYCGSAVIYSINDDYTYVITNYHVLYDYSSVASDKLAERIVCYLYGSESTPTATNATDSNGCTIYDYGDYGIECEYVGGSITTDLAVIKAKTSDVKKINENVRAIEFANEYHVGETAIAIGNSEDEGISVTKGIVSVDNEYIYYDIDGNQRSYRSMRIDTAIYGGNSGGGLFDSDGKLIGITNAGDSTDQNINYAIPVNIVKPIVENILYYSDGGVKVLKLGITVLPKNSKYVYNEDKGYGDIVEDVYCDEITSGSLAEDLGLKEGDKLVSLTVNGKTYSFNRYFNLGDILYTIRQGDEIYFTYYRGDIFVEKSTEVTIASKNLVDVS